MNEKRINSFKKYKGKAIHKKLEIELMDFQAKEALVLFYGKISDISPKDKRFQKKFDKFYQNLLKNLTCKPSPMGLKKKKRDFPIS